MDDIQARMTQVKFELMSRDKPQNFTLDVATDISSRINNMRDSLNTFKLHTKTRQDLL